MSFEEKIYTETSAARQEGRQEGRIEGRQEGRIEGEIIGTKKERTEIIEQLKAAGVDESIIKQIRDRK